MEIQRALSDLADVRDRLARLQRFEGYSGPAAAASGVAALIAGYAQFQTVPFPRKLDDVHIYLAIWLSCLAAGLLLNYGTVGVWLFKHRGPAARSQFRSAALSIAPSIILGGALSLALIDNGVFALLPGTWFACYAIGLFASRAAIPESSFGVTVAFALLALIFLITPATGIALSWWVMPLGFGIGQLVMGYLVWRDRTL